MLVALKHAVCSTALHICVPRTARISRGSCPNFAPAGTDILNFALQLECLEAEFYSWAAYGESLSARIEGDIGPSPLSSSKPPGKANLTPISQVRTPAGTVCTGRPRRTAFAKHLPESWTVVYCMCLS